MRHITKVPFFGKHENRLISLIENHKGQILHTYFCNLPEGFALHHDIYEKKSFNGILLLWEAKEISCEEFLQLVTDRYGEEVMNYISLVEQSKPVQQ
jgi:hypothetical protein